MLKKDVIEYFGSQQKIADAIGYTKGAISQWPERVPEKAASRLSVITGGELKYDIKDYPPKVA